MNADSFKEVMLDLEAHWHRDELPEEVYVVYLRELGGFTVEEVRTAITALARAGERRMPLAGQIRAKVIELRLDAPTWGQAVRELRNAVRALDEFRYPERCVDGNPECDGMGWATHEETVQVERRSWCECATANATRARKRHQRERGEPYEPCTVGVCDGSGLIDTVEPRIQIVASRCTCAAKLAPDLGIHQTVHSFARLVGWDEIKRYLLTANDSNVEAQMRKKYEQHVRDEIDSLSLVGIHASGLARVERAQEYEPRVPSLPTGDLEPLGESVRAALPSQTAA